MKKILLVNEASTFNSGLGKYGYHLLAGLKSKGYKVAELAFGKHVNPPDDGHISWPIYYNNVYPNDHRSKILNSDQENQWGKWRFDKVCLHYKPDYVLSITDPWHSRFIRVAPTRRYFRYIAMPTADTFPLKPNYYAAYTNPDGLLTYSAWAKEMLDKQWPGLVHAAAYYGVDRSIYFPMKNKDIVRKNMGLSQGDTVIGMIAKNQPRKLFAELIFAFKKVSERCPNAYLYLHTMYPEKIGWDIPNLLNQADVAHKVYFTYTCLNCKNFYPSIYKGEKIYCGLCKQHSACIKAPSFVIPEDNMNILLNTFDIYIQYASSEGAGMPVAEAACCGLPIVVVKTTAMRDYEKTLNAHMITAKEYYTHAEHGFRGLPMNSECVDILVNLCNKPHDMLRVEGFKNLKLVHENYDWGKTVDTWAELIEKIPPKNMWNSPKQEFTKLPQDNQVSAFDLYLVWQDYLGVNDPYSYIKMARESQLGDVRSINPYLSGISRSELIKNINIYIDELNIIERIRVGESKLIDEDFIEYAKIKEIVNAD